MNEKLEENDQKYAIILEHLYFEVPEKKILKDISFSIYRGEILSIMGMSGCGKTTILHCIGALTRPTSGEIFIEGEAIASLNEKKLNVVREKMGMVFQYAALFDSLSVFENVAFGLRRRRSLSETEISEIVEAKLALAAVSGTENLLPAQLSGGMAKRVGLARALAMEPSILLYDEPTSGLDPVVCAKVDQQIMRMRNELKVTSVVVSHNLDSVFRMSDRIAMLHEGELLAFGTPDEIRSSKDPKVRQFIEGQADGPLSLGLDF
jgi:phospholipid/cholesterol/gamma-HCH transport system ATP-binding protein